MKKLGRDAGTVYLCRPKKGLRKAAFVNKRLLILL